MAEYLLRKEVVPGGSFQIPRPLPYHPIVIFKTKISESSMSEKKLENNYKRLIVTTTYKTHTHVKVSCTRLAQPM